MPLLHLHQEPQSMVGRLLNEDAKFAALGCNPKRVLVVPSHIVHLRMAVEEVDSVT